MTDSLSRPNPFMLVLIAAVLLLGVMGFTYAASNHAETTHVWDAQKIMKCLNDNGPHLKMVFRSKDNKFYFPCLLPDGRIGMGIFDKFGNNISAYIPKDGTWAAVRKYIEERATHFTGRIPFIMH